MKLNRRQLLIAGVAGSVFGAQRPAVAPLIDRGFARVTQLAPGVYATIADVTKGMQAVSNGGVLVGRDAVLIIEGHMQPAGAAVEVEVAKMVSKKPIHGAVDTHFHLDHTFGNVSYEEQHIPIIAHENVLPLMKEQYAAVKGVDKAPLLAPHEKRLANAEDGTEKQRKTGDLAFWKMMYAAIDATTLAFPTESLGSADLPKRLDLGGLTAILEFHPGHTSSDLIVRVPERDIVFTGDLLFNGAYPVTIDADMIGWRKVLDYFAGCDRRTRFVPGHRAVCGLEIVREQAALFDDLRGHAEKMIHSGANVEEAERRYVVPARLAHCEIHSWGISVGSAMRSYYAKLAPGARTV